jgi:UDP-N-acetylmuramate--alanine ligase
VTQKENVYFVGVGGIGMSALARYFLACGYRVGGYDKTETILTKKLSEEGVDIHYKDDLVFVNKAFKEKENTLVIYTPAIPNNHSELKYFKKQGFELLKRAQVLGRITESTRSVGVAGTHGKTTISSMIAHIFNFCKVPFTAFLGGLSKDLGSNYYHDYESEITVIEADEYDRSFLELKPSIAVVSAIDPDHLDIYGTKAEMQRTFRQFLVENLHKNGVGIIHSSLTKTLGNRYKTYSIEDDKADYYAANFRVENTEFIADFRWAGRELKAVKIGLPGIHNMENALVAFSVGIEEGIHPQKLKEAISSYSGVHRRFDVHIKSDKIVYIDDYAHHPEEIKKLVKSVRKMYPDRSIIGVFQPHLYSRTKDFAQDFAKSLELLDELLLLDVYPARELPIPGVNSQMLFDLIRMNSKTLCSKKEVLSQLSASKCNVVLTIGAGDIGSEVQKIKEFLLN